MDSKNNILEHKISIIVPVFNVEKYIEKCITSLINQTYKNIEIILVDDGSTDKSGQICDLYAKKDEKIIVLHTDNQGVSVARNIGIEHATGDFIGFVDSDDYVKETMFEELSKGLSDFVDADISMCNFYVNEKYKEIKSENLFAVGDEILKYIIADGEYKGFIWNKLFKKEIIKNRNISFKTNIHMCEDLIFCIEYMQFVKKATLIKVPLYYYEDRSESISNSSFNLKRYSIIEAYDYILSLKNVRKNIDIYRVVKLRQIKHELSMWNMLRKSNSVNNKKIYMSEIKRKIKKCNGDFIFDNTYGMKYKILFLLLKLF